MGGTATFELLSSLQIVCLHLISVPHFNKLSNFVFCVAVPIQFLIPFKVAIFFRSCTHWVMLYKIFLNFCAFAPIYFTPIECYNKNKLRGRGIK